MTAKQERIIKIYKGLKVTREVWPSYGVVAKKAKCSKATAYQTIMEWKRQQEVFGLDKN